VNFITYLEPPYLLDYNYIVVPLPTGFFVSAYLNGEGVQEIFTHRFGSMLNFRGPFLSNPLGLNAKRLSPWILYYYLLFVIYVFS
jgi:hypothetical protein